MKAKCAACGCEYEVSAEGTLGSCVSCGGQLKRVTAETPAIPPVTPTPQHPGAPNEAKLAQQEPLELAEDSLAAGITCPNCGKWIDPGAQICTACGYSRRLGRTLSTRVGTPEVPRHKPRAANVKPPETPEIEAEKAHRRAKERTRGGTADALRLLVALAWLLALTTIVMTAPTGWLQDLPLKLPPLLLPPKFDPLNASFLMLMFLCVALPVTAIGVRIAAAIIGIELRTHFSWLRTAGVLAAMLVTMVLVYSVGQLNLHLPTPSLLLALAAGAALALLLFTWFLHDVSFSGAIVLSLATLISAALGLAAAAVAFAWIGHLAGIDPVIPANPWEWRTLIA